jgi:hypothetical protein
MEVNGIPTCTIVVFFVMFNILIGLFEIINSCLRVNMSKGMHYCNRLSRSQEKNLFIDYNQNKIEQIKVIA